MSETKIIEGVEVFFACEKISEKHDDSFWYDGHIATLTYKDRKLKIYAVGEIRINTSKEGGELVHDGYKSRNSGIELNNDDDLEKIGCNYDDEYYWENNNWFDFLFAYKNDNWNDLLGDVSYGYDNSIEMAISWLKDDEWWKDIEKEYKES